jgi:adhesin transport system outer membrane protein
LRLVPAETAAGFRSILTVAAALIGLIPLLPAGAQEDRAGLVNYEMAAGEAVSWHPSIVEAAARLSQQEQQIDVAQASYYPQVTGGVGVGYDSASTARWAPRANLGVNQRIWDFGKTASEVAAERAGMRARKAAVLLAVDAIVRDTSYAIIEIRRSRELLEVAQEQRDSVSAIGLLVETRYRQGAATRSDALQALSRVDAAESTILQIEAELRRWQSNLAFLLGRETAPEVNGEGEESFEGACQNRDIDWMQVPAMLRAEAEREQALAELRRARADRYPTISLGAGASTDIHDPFDDRRTDYNVGLNVSTSLFDGGARGAGARSADYALNAAEAALDAARLESTRLLAEAREQVTIFRERLDTLDMRQAKMEETRKLYRLQYLELGTRTLVDLLNAEQEVSQIRFDAVNSRYDLVRLGVDCLYTTGDLRFALGLDGTTIEGVVL